MKVIFFFFIFGFRSAEQLSCFVRCLAVTIRESKDFVEPSARLQCLNDTRATNCHARLVTYYQDENLPRYLTYTLGPRKHAIETQIGELAEDEGVKSIVYFLFVVEAVDTSEVVISAYVVCRTGDNCALNVLRDLFHSYQTKPNPLQQLKALLHDGPSLPTLFCFNSATKQVEECSLPACIFNQTDTLEQKCHSGSSMKLEYGMMITSRDTIKWKKSLEVVVCSIVACNSQQTLDQVRKIVYNYTLAQVNVTASRASVRQWHVLHWICLWTIHRVFGG